jgi:hypothetical protein
MATELTSAGYLDLRQAIQARWLYVSIRSDADAELLRLEIAADARCTWQDNGTPNPTELVIALSGDDADISGVLPMTIAGTKLFKGAAGGDAMDGDTFTAATLASADPADMLTITHKIQVPIIA